MTTRDEKIERGREVLRRQGRADAVAMLVAKKFRPGLTLDDYARVLEVDGADVRAALARRRPAPPTPPVRSTRRVRSDGPHLCPEPGCDESYGDRRGLASHRLAAHSEPVPCPKGCGRLINQRGIGPHTAHCSGAAE